MIGIIIHVFILSGVLIWVYQNRIRPDFKRYFVPGILFKVIGAILFGIYYLKIGGGDTMKYHEAALVWKDYFYSDFLSYCKDLFLSDESFSRYFIDQPRAVFFTKIVSVFEIVTFGNYWLCTLYFALISFCGSWLLFKRLSNRFDSPIAWFFVLFLFPSVLFWCSGIVKETVSLAILCYLSSLVLKYYNGTFKPNYLELVTALLSVWVLIKLKYYVAGVFIPVMIGVLVIRNFGKTLEKLSGKNYAKIGLMLGVVFIFLIAATNINHNLSLENVLDRIVMTHDQLYRMSDQGFRIEYQNLESSWDSILKNSPIALVSGLFRPFVWEKNTLLAISAGVENSILFFIVISAILIGIKDRNYPGVIGFGILIYVVIMAIFLALATPNFGTLMRFKTAFSPFLLMLCIYSLKETKLFRTAFKGYGKGEVVSN